MASQGQKEVWDTLETQETGGQEEARWTLNSRAALITGIWIVGLGSSCEMLAWQEHQYYVSPN